MSPLKSPKQSSVRDVGKKNKIVAKKVEADELPPGWKMVAKRRETGSKTKVDRRFTDPVTGYIFRSLKDVRRYLKTGELGRLAIKPKNIVDERLHMEEREERSECESKEQMSETLRCKRPVDTTGSELCETDCRFTPDVHEMSPVKLPEQSSARDVGKTYKIVVEKDEADELPPGWTTEARTRKSGSETKVDRRYTDPVTGYIFRSLKDVRRYLKTGKLGRLAIKPKKTECVDMDNKDKRLHMEEREERSESKEQMSETLRCKRPLDKTGSEFSEKGKSESHQHASKRLVVAPSPPLPEPKTRQATRLANTKTDTPSRSLPMPEPEPKTRQATRLAKVAVNESLSSPSHVGTKTRNATRKAGIEINLSPPSPPDTRTSRLAIRQAGIKIEASATPPPAPKTYQAAQQSGIKTDLPPPSLQDFKTRQVTPQVGTEILPSPPTQPEPKIRQAKRLSSIRGNASVPQLKTRRVTRQAGIKIESPPPSPPDTRSSRQATGAKLVHLATPKKNNENPKEHNKEIEMGPATLPFSEDQTPPTSVVPLVDFAKHELPVVNPTVSNPVSQDGYGYGVNVKSDSSINFSMSDLWTDPCIEFAVKTLTGAIPFVDLNKPENPSPSTLKVPLEELWTDPCIEFAVKTLTGAIPVGEDDHLQHRPSASKNTRAPHDFFLPDVGMGLQTDAVSKRFETGQNKQPQDSTYVNGQCSKSRFF